MKLKIRRSEDRGKAEHGWLHARFSFSFANYFDPDHCGFHSLIVMNNDVIEPGSGFPTHPHQDAEIFTYVIRGKLEHKDSIGNGSVIDAGNLQYMSAGNGVQHSEFNPSSTEQTELYQIWMQPQTVGGEPKYAEKPLDSTNLKNEIRLLFSKNGRGESTKIRQQADFYFGNLDAGKITNLQPDPTLPHAWLQVISGEIMLEDYTLHTADGIGIENLDEEIILKTNKNTEFFLFRMATS
jgi:redox-sensitive bicupin YhaK (pirin superfamily)